MSKSNEMDTLKVMLELMQDAADTAVDVDRHQDSRIWADLNLLMSGDHVDFVHIKVLLPKFLTSYGEYRLVSFELIDKLTRYIDTMHDINIQIKTKTKFPNASLPNIRTLKRQYNKIKSKWDKNLLYAMKLVNVDTKVKYDKFALLQVLGKEKSNSNGNVNFDDIAG